MSILIVDNYFAKEWKPSLSTLLLSSKYPEAVIETNGDNAQFYDEVYFIGTRKDECPGAGWAFICHNRPTSVLQREQVNTDAYDKFFEGRMFSKKAIKKWKEEVFRTLYFSPTSNYFWTTPYTKSRILYSKTIPSNARFLLSLPEDIEMRIPIHGDDPFLVRILKERKGFYTLEARLTDIDLLGELEGIECITSITLRVNSMNYMDVYTALSWGKAFPVPIRIIGRSTDKTIREFIKLFNGVRSVDTDWNTLHLYLKENMRRYNILYYEMRALQGTTQLSKFRLHTNRWWEKEQETEDKINELI